MMYAQQSHVQSLKMNAYSASESCVDLWPLAFESVLSDFSDDADLRHPRPETHVVPIPGYEKQIITLEPWFAKFALLAGDLPLCR